jgi:hypothetical protein
LSRSLGALAITAVATLAGAQDAPGTMGVDDLRRGQRGYGLSVFEGSEPARFEVEVLGVVRNSSPGGSFVLARLSGQGLEESGVVAGMSGSPVYIDDRLIGAVAFAWPFSNGAVGGITPIASMRRLSTTEITRSVTPGGASFGGLMALRESGLDPQLLRTEIGRLLPRLPGQARNGLVWSLGGFGEISRAFLETALAAAVPAGDAEGLRTNLQPGSSVAGVLVDGDLQLAVTGTVTDRVGDEILAFGHAFLGQGPLRLPMASSDVVTVLSNQLSSFKIANVGEVVGSFDLDLVSGVRGRIGAMVETIPLTIRVEGMGQAAFEMELADVPAYLPSLVAIASLGAFDEASRSGGAQGVDLEVSWELERHGTIEVSQSFDGSGAAFGAALYMLMYTNFLTNNALEETRLKSVSIDLTQHSIPRTGRVVSGFANRTVVRPGETVAVTLEIQPYRGELFEHRLDLTLPADLAQGRYTVIVADGVTADIVRQMVELVEPQTFGQSLDMVRRFHSNRDLVALGLVPAAGLTLSGRVLPQLPSSMMQLWGPVPPGGARPLGLAVVQEISRPLERPLSGGVRIDFEVRRSATTSMAPTPTPEGGGHWATNVLARGLVVGEAASASRLLGGIVETNETAQEDRQ